MRWGIDARTIQDHFPGIGSYSFALIRHMAPLAPNDELVVFYDPAAHNTRFDLATLGEQPNVRLVASPWSTFGAAQQMALRQAARRERLHLYHSPYYLMPYALPCPAVVTVHDLIPHAMPGSLPDPRLAPLYRLLVGLAVRRAAHVIVDSQATREDLLRYRHVAPGRVTSIPLAAEERFHPVSADALRLRLKLDRPYLLYLGTNKPHKNLVRLVNAWASVPAAARGDCQLVLAGYLDPRYPQAAQAAAPLGEAVRLLGEVAAEDLPALYSGARWLVFPSLYEGFGLPVLEAMACGTPVACSRGSSLGEVAGDAALTFDPTDVPSIAAVLARLPGDDRLRSEMAPRAREQAARFSWEATARATLAVYHHVLETRAVP